MNIRTDRYLILDSALNSGRNYWDQDLYPQWADLRLLGYSPAARPGEGVEPHYHDADEFWLFLSGRGEVWLDGRSFAITPNTLVYTPMGVTHRFQVFTDSENCPALPRLERAKRPLHLYPEVHGQPQPTVPGFVISGADNTGPFADRGPRCPLSELRALDLAAGERVAEAPAAQTEYWLVLNGAVQLSVEGQDVELGPRDLAILRAGVVRQLGAEAGGRVALARE